MEFQDLCQFVGLCHVEAVKKQFSRPLTLETFSVINLFTKCLLRRLFSSSASAKGIDICARRYYFDIRLPQKMERKFCKQGSILTYTNKTLKQHWEEYIGSEDPVQVLIVLAGP